MGAISRMALPLGTAQREEPTTGVLRPNDGLRMTGDADRARRMPNAGITPEVIENKSRGVRSHP